MVTKYDQEKFCFTAAPRSGKTWAMLARASASGGTIIVSSEERKAQLMQMAKHMGIPCPTIAVWKPKPKNFEGYPYRYVDVLVDDMKALRGYRGDGKTAAEALQTLNEIQERLEKQHPYPYADIQYVKVLKAVLYGDWEE